MSDTQKNICTIPKSPPTKSRLLPRLPHKFMPAIERETCSFASNFTSTHPVIVSCPLFWLADISHVGHEIRVTNAEIALPACPKSPLNTETPIRPQPDSPPPHCPGCIIERVALPQSNTARRGLPVPSRAAQYIVCHAEPPDSWSERGDSASRI